MKINTKIDRQDIYYWFILGALIMIGYWVYIVVAPTFEIVQDTNTLIKQSDKVLDYAVQQNALQINQSREAIDQNNRIIANQNNNSKTIQNLIIENRENQEESIYFLVSILNQSNVIGNHTADLILDSISQLKTLQQNISSERQAQSLGILHGFSTILEDLDEDADDNREALRKVVQSLNITLPEQVLRDEFRFDPEAHTFSFPNGTTQNLTELFMPAALLTREGQVYGQDQVQNQNQNQNQVQDENMSGNVSGFLGGPLLTSKDLEELNANISKYAQNQSSELDLSKYGSPD